jgi:hypothetical protein
MSRPRTPLKKRFKDNTISFQGTPYVPLRLAMEMVKNVASRGYSAGCEAAHRIHDGKYYDTHSEAVEKLIEDPDYHHFVKLRK